MRFPSIRIGNIARPAGAEEPCRCRCRCRHCRCDCDCPQAVRRRSERDFVVLVSRLRAELKTMIREALNEEVAP